MSRGIRRIWLFPLLLGAVALLPATTLRQRPPTVALLVGIEPGGPVTAINAMAVQAGAAVVSHNDSIGMVELEVPAGAASQLTTALARVAGVRYVEPDRDQFTPASMPSDPMYAASGQWNIDRIQAPQAWDLLPAGGTTLVAILDTGIDFNHPEFAGRISPAACSAFHNQCPQTGGGRPQDLNSHGTHVAGIIGAATNNGVGVASVTAGRVTLLPIQVLSAGGGSIRESSVVNGIVYAVNQGAKVINLSLGDGCGGAFFGKPMDEAIAYAEAHDTLLVWAAGNGGGCYEGTWPENDRRVLSVAATDSMDRGAVFSDRGSWVGVAAPGQDILSTVPVARGSYASFSGTSMAAPHVTGAAALLFQVPGATKQKVVEWLMATCDSALVSVQCGGRINLYRAVALATTGTDPAKAVTAP